MRILLACLVLGTLLQRLNATWYDADRHFYTYYPESDRYEGLGNALLLLFGYNFHPIEHPTTPEHCFPALWPTYDAYLPHDWYSQTPQHIWVDNLIARLTAQDTSFFCAKYAAPIQASDDIKEMVREGTMLGGSKQLWGAVAVLDYIHRLAWPPSR